MENDPEVEVEQKDPDLDIALMLAFRDGDEAAFDRLFRRWAGPLLRYLERMIGDGAVAEELVQETFFRVHRARARYESRARFSTWLYRIATNLAINELKRPRRRHVHQEEDKSDLQAVGWRRRWTPSAWGWMWGENSKNFPSASAWRFGFRLPRDIPTPRWR